MPILKAPVTSKWVQRFGNDKLRGACVQLSGWRDHMEDEVAVQFHDNLAFLGLFDGHAGGSCSRYLKQQFADAVFRNVPGRSVDAWTNLCAMLDDRFLESKKKSGSTATFATLSLDEMRATIGNVGDSRTMHIRDGHIHFKTQDHKPDVPSEIHRIEKAGGSIDHAQEAVRSRHHTHILRMTRSFGDADFDACKPDPDISVVKLREGDVLLLCSDGILDGVDIEKAVPRMMSFLESTHDPALAASALIDWALRGNSMDNMSVLLVQIGSKRIIGQPALPPREFIPGPLRMSAPNYLDAWIMMASRAGLSLSEALILRANHIQSQATQTESGLPIETPTHVEKRLLHNMLKSSRPEEAVSELASKLIAKLEPARVADLEVVKASNAGWMDGFSGNAWESNFSRHLHKDVHSDADRRSEGRATPVPPPLALGGDDMSSEGDSD